MASTKLQITSDCSPIFPLALERGPHLFPFRTEQLSLSSPMVLAGQLAGRVGRQREYFSDQALDFVSQGLFLLYMKRFFEWNRRLSERVGSGFPHVKAHNTLNWAKDVADYLNLRPGARVLDVGAGRQCLFVEYMRDPKSVSVVGVDISRDEMQRNRDLCERHIADVSSVLPFPDHTFDAVVSHSVLEHLDSQKEFFAEAARVLKPGGAFIHWLPNKYAPFAILNRLIPNRLSRKLLHATWDETKGISGFPAKYDQCSPSQIRKLLKAHGFVDPTIQISYYSSSYYAFFFPFYMISLLYETLTSAHGARSLASYMLIRANAKP